MMAEEEFQESEVIFNENQVIEEYNDETDYLGYSNPKPKRKKLRAKKNSVPMNIPDNLARNTWFQVATDMDFSDDDGGGGGGGDDHEMVPPHVIIRQRIAGKVMSFSVCSGNGRTLKGRDLSEVRNSILRLTGFLET